ncbi:zinc-binding dehydrogenase [Levilactobacillus tongjiangensis]|uniref:Zinc-binding dehydrogenase n=1 Tax=Levilactobacillus tongjiangensis TaxID=2486023 RepID=A0ABW1ST40_9LACO|nr:zinc-binding dehydrogenase [Levilactobacillus tongjiangensis]
MKAIVVEHPGGPEVLTLHEVDRPTVKPGWTLIEVKGRGVNHSEIFTRDGESPSVKFPRILGIEAVGVVAETTDAQRLPVGQTVVTFMGEMGRAYDGSYAEFALIPNQQIFPVTTTLSWADLAAVPETGYTAFGALQGLKIRNHDQLLVRGGTSGVGVMAAKLAHALATDLTVTATTRNLAKRDQLLAAGFDAVILDKDGELQTDQRYDEILELIGAATVPDSLQHLTPGGIVSATGELGGQWELQNFEPVVKIPSNTYLTAFYSGDIDEARLRELFRVIDTHHVDVRPAKVFALQDMRAAHEYLASHQSFGKVVVLS